MKTFQIALILLLVTAATNTALGQKRTVETRTPVDSTTSVIVSETEDITPRKHALMVNPLEFFLFYNLTYYHSISPSVAIGAGFRVPTIKALDGAGVHAEARFYPSKRSLKGFYIAPKASINRFTEDDGNDSVTASSLGIRAGWQWFVGRDFSIGFGLGIDHYVLSGSSDDDDFDSVSGNVPALRFNIGYAW
ncbi:MAG: hypothetical protein ACE5G0_01445 [Rhodothermales bacterium]